MAYPPPSSSTPSTQVELHISCKDLRKADLLSKSDPLTVVSSCDGTGAWSEHARTELIKNNQNPQFSKAVEMVYKFEEIQKLRFSVYDLDNDTSSLADDDFLGELEVTLGEIVSNGVLTKPLAAKGGASGQGTITIRVEETSSRKSLLTMKFSAQGLDKKDLLGKSDPYLEFERENKDGSYSSVLKTRVLTKTLNPNWPQLSTDTKKFVNNDPTRKVRVRCFDWDSDGSHDLIGEFYTTLEELTQAAQENKKLEWPVINPSKQSKKKYKNSGTCYLDAITVVPTYSFLDYVMGGCQINFTVGIDFTASNLNPTDPSSLHYIHPAQPNQYTQALLAVGSICQDYDTDKLFPALGFGGKIGEKVSHEFALNGNPQNPYCNGVYGVVEAYHKALQSVELWGPTNAAPIINHVANFAEASTKNPETQQYYVLLMLTDGVLSDMQDTKRAIIRASRLPMSIIIVGVGKANFSSMNELDADDKLLKVGNEKAERDIVQFVPFRDFPASLPGKLASAVLAEIPQQLEQYMTKRKLVPLRRY